MKIKSILFSLLALCVIVNAPAQGLYFKLGGGYALPMGSQSLMESMNINSDIVGNSTVVTSSSESIKGSYGAGINYDFAAGYKFTPFIGIDLNVSYQTGREYEGNSLATSGNLNYEIIQSSKANGIFFAPTAMFMTGAGMVRPYLMVGAVMGTTKIDDATEVYLGGRDTPINGVIRYETKGELAFGFRGGAGIDFYVSPQFAIYAQATFNSISYYAKEKNITEYIVDGTDAIDNLTTRQKTTVYVDKVTETQVDGNVVIDDSKPTEELRKPLPLSNITFGIGVKFRLTVD